MSQRDITYNLSLMISHNSYNKIKPIIYTNRYLHIDSGISSSVHDIQYIHIEIWENKHYWGEEKVLNAYQIALIFRSLLYKFILNVLKPTSNQRNSREYGLFKMKSSCCSDPHT